MTAMTMTGTVSARHAIQSIPLNFQYAALLLSADSKTSGEALFLRIRILEPAETRNFAGKKQSTATGMYTKSINRLIISLRPKLTASYIIVMLTMSIKTLLMKHSMPIKNIHVPVDLM
jgi:hypothetical protein